MWHSKAEDRLTSKLDYMVPFSHFLTSMVCMEQCIHFCLLEASSEDMHVKEKRAFDLFFFFFFLAYGRSQARGQIKATAASLHHSQIQIQMAFSTYTTALSNAVILNPLNEARDQTRIVMNTSRVHYR